MTFATTDAKILASARLSPSKTNCRRHAVGTLAEGNDLWPFEYDREWAGLPDSLDLSPALTRLQLEHEHGGSERPVQ